MKKIIVSGLTLITAFAFVSPAVATGDVSPINSQTEITVKSLSGSIRNPKVFPLANGSSLVSWLEDGADGYFLRARTVSATNKLGIIQTINSEKAAFLDRTEGVQETIAINRSGQLFAVWATLGTRYNVPSQKIWGRTSLDGSNWSKPFVVIPGLSVTGDPDMCMMEAAFTPRCGFIKLQAAIDDKGRLAVLVADNLETTGTRYRMKTRSFTGKWCNFKTLSPVRETRTSEIVGLTSGFVASATRYGGTTNSVKTSYYDPKAEAWTSTSTPVVTSANVVFTSHWVQRDTKNLTLALANTSTAGALSMRNFNVDSKTWTTDLITLHAGEPEHVIQDLRAAKVGANLVVLYNVYGQSAHISAARVAKVIGTTATTSELGTSIDQIDALYVGSSMSSNPVVAYNHIMEGTKLGGITGLTLPSFLPNTATHSYLSAMAKTRSDKILAVGLNFGEGTTSVVFTQGFVK